MSSTTPTCAPARPSPSSRPSTASASGFDPDRGAAVIVRCTYLGQQYQFHLGERVPTREPVQCFRARDVSGPYDALEPDRVPGTVTVLLLPLEDHGRRRWLRLAAMLAETPAPALLKVLAFGPVESG